MVEDLDYTPTGFVITANTLSCYQMGGLTYPRDPSISPVDMGRFQAVGLLRNGYRILYDPEGAQRILDDGINRGYVR